MSCGSCCFGTKEDYLGNNFILSEYSNKERQILYSEEKCAVSGIPIVPMTVEAYAFNSNWIIAKSSEEKYWIIDKRFHTDGMTDKSKDEYIRSHVSGPLDSVSFIRSLHNLKINLELARITP
jgi:hypothetical protein